MEINRLLSLINCISQLKNPKKTHHRYIFLMIPPEYELKTLYCILFLTLG